MDNQAAHQHHSHRNATAASVSSKKGSDTTGVNSTANSDASAVRFSSNVQEIAPGQPSSRPDNGEQSKEVAVEQLKEYTKSLQGQHLQERRMNTFAFEPFSLPPSRVPSQENESGESSKLPTPSSATFQHSPHGSPRLSAMASPPLTPAGSDPALADKRKEASGKAPGAHDYQSITPQASSSQEKAPFTHHRHPLTHRPASSDHVFQRSASAEDRQREQGSHRRGMFGGGTGSVPHSRESSPSRSAASNYYSKPMTPGGDANDPYAKGRRPPQQHSHHSIDPRFIFSRKKKQSSGSSNKGSSDKRSSVVFGKSTSEEFPAGDSVGPAHGHGHQGSISSMSDLKRFFKPGRHKKKDSSKRESSPASTRTGTQTPPASRSTTQLPFGDDHGLISKYGKIGKVLGSGAGGSVRLMKRRDDGTVFAVKEFRARHAYETEKEYNKKVTAEFCVGSTLHHGNIIETLDILHEKGRWYEVMEYAPFDLFAIVMTGKMGREEITCCFLQILNGVTYLHSLGLTHRDMKLDNVVVSDKGIMKIIDFGSAHVYRYPFESEIVPAKGIVGSDPYLAPEVYDNNTYDAAPVDIWSLAIIFCCMTLRRFPWKLPRMTDNSYKLFASEPTPGHDPAKLVSAKRSNEVSAQSSSEGENKTHSYKSHRRDESSSTAAPEVEASSSQHAAGTTSDKKEVIKGPWRILRLLPRESRHIIWRMLEIDPKKRATMEEILAEPWIADTIICQQLDYGQVIPAEDHEHILEPPASQPTPPKGT